MATLYQGSLRLMKTINRKKVTTGTNAANAQRLDPRAAAVSAKMIPRSQIAAQ